jgi:hypothetical protein
MNSILRSLKNDSNAASESCDHDDKKRFAQNAKGSSISKGQSQDEVKQVKAKDKIEHPLGEIGLLEQLPDKIQREEKADRKSQKRPEAQCQQCDGQSAAKINAEPPSKADAKPRNGNGFVFRSAHKTKLATVIDRRYRKRN